MKITKQRLREIIKEEMRSIIEEGAADTFAFRQPAATAGILTKILSIESRLRELAQELSGVVATANEMAVDTQHSSNLGAHSK
jgi:hypothetical protein